MERFGVIKFYTKENANAEGSRKALMHRGGPKSSRKGTKMTYKEMINRMRNDWIGRKVQFGGRKYRVIDVDYNGCLVIDKPAQFTETTVIGVHQIDKD